MSRRPLKLILPVALLSIAVMASASTSPAKPLKCKKGYVKKGRKCVKKPTGAAKDSTYIVGDPDSPSAVLKITNKGTKATVNAKITVDKLNCTAGEPSGYAASSVNNMPIVKRNSFSGTGPVNSGQWHASIQGKFLSATKVQVTAAVTDYPSFDQNSPTPDVPVGKCSGSDKFLFTVKKP